MFKRIMSVMLAVVMLFSIAVVVASAADEKVYVKVDGDVYYEVQKGDTITYVYSLACEKKICSLDCTTLYDATGLKFVPAVDEYGDNTGEEFPNITAVYNFGLDSKIVYNYSSPSGTRFPVADTLAAKNVVFQGKFEVTADSGIYEINTNLKVLGDNENNKIVFDSAVVDEAVVFNTNGALEGLTPVDAPTDPQPTEPQPTQPQPTQPQPTKPEETKPEATEPEATEDEVTEPEATEAETEVPSAATKDQSSTNDTKKPTNSNTVKTGSTAAAVALITVLVMAAGVVVFSRKKISE